MSVERKHYFTAKEANYMIPMLEISFYRLVQMRGLVKERIALMRDLGFTPVDEDIYAPPEGIDNSVLECLLDLRMINDALREELEFLSSKGCIIKCLKRGIVDWRSRIGGQEVFLCWKLGEKSVTHWHEVDSDFKTSQKLLVSLQ